MQYHSATAQSAYHDLRRSLMDDQVATPRPERYAIHKLIVADRRSGTDRLKARKDMAQAALLIEDLAEDRPDELREAYQDAQERGPQGRAHIAATLKRMPETVAKLAAL